MKSIVNIRNHQLFRIFAFILSLSGFIWILIGNFQFRQSIRIELKDAERVMEHEATSSTDRYKVLNSYYESIYENMPPTFIPASMLMLGSALLLLARKPNN